ncbi:MAG: polysaccharide biosynthesis protein [Planctomycetota bacterium]|jgi:FlaA1/EpsC-like NDP-sugar epimerase
MPDSNTHQKSKNQNPLELTTPPVVLLTFRKPLIILAHLAAFASSLMLSFLLANNMQFKRDWLVEQYPLLLLFFIIIKLVIFGLFKQYRGWWRYVGITDLFGIAGASLVSTIIIIALWFTMLNTTSVRRALVNLTEVSQGVFMADLFATILLLAGLRMAIRLYYEEFRTVEGGRLKRFLIVGAGDAGEALLREIHRMPVAQYDVIGFIDDDPSRQGINIHGIPILGTVEQLPTLCKERNIEEIAIAMPSATHQERRRVVQVCSGNKIMFQTVPSITDIASGKLSVSQIRNVDINDLLGREAVNLDLDLIEAFVKDKTILVTGAGGSIGSEMSRQVCNFNPKLLLLIEQAENPLFYIERELRKQFPSIPVKTIICNITDKIRVDEIFEKYKPQVVIHAAAHKHVPLMELNPGEAIKNNIVGTQIVADAADNYGTTNVVMISTDKAVNPTSIMGSSKRIAEMYIQDLNRTSKTHFVTVRFGNVLDSDGSVVPIFKKQIAQGGPVTVTHPKMKRYFMTIPEASQLVLQAATMGKGGEIFVLDMGEPVKILDLARDLITLSGFKPGEDVEIVFTNPRPGEKLFEELSLDGEDMQHTRHPKISIWKNIPMDRDKLRSGINKLLTIAQTQNHSEIVQKIKELVPEYIGGNNQNAEVIEEENSD